ncbi:hypothetical protein F5B18DRAFT_180543 [Nemania serpens]|nr:hypothetical protein F5B18DRAFT_180543 [Nemania serpens]
MNPVSLVHTQGPWACATASFYSEHLDTELVDRFSRASVHAKFKYQYDCTFHDITPIYEDKNDSRLDILAVPGLASHAVGSWKAAGGNDIWLRDYLPDDISGLRVLLYGYDTNLLKSDSRKSIEDMGKTLLELVTAFRANSQVKRPIILIGHSLGGLLIKEALLHASKSRRYDLSETCVGLLFFGVPNHGLRNEQLLSLVNGQPNAALIRDLLVDQDTEPSTFLKRISSQFAESCKGQYPVISFYELKPSPIIQRQTDGTLTKSSDKVLMVTQKSATSTGITAVVDEDNVALDVDHSGLVKFSSRTCGSYSIVRERIRLLATNSSRVNSRFANKLEPEAMRAWNNMNTPPYSSFRNSARLAKPEEGTLQWLLQAPPTEPRDPLYLQSQDFQAWRDSDKSQCLLLTGPPGQGKSVLSNFIISHLEDSALPGSRIIYYFCTIKNNNVGDRNAGSVLRSLIVQLCEDQQQLFDLIPTDVTRQSNFSSASTEILLDVFEKMLRGNVYKTVFCIIDGLDVYADDMLDLIQELARLLNAFSGDQKSMIKLLCTSRPHKRIMDAWGQAPRKALRCEANDLQRFIHSRVALLDYTEDMRRHIETRLGQNAGRTFLWIDVVIRRLRTISFPSATLVDKAITNSSSDLYELYTSLVQDLLQIDKQNAKQNAAILAWVVNAQRPLRCGELAEAISVDLQDDHPSYQKCSDNKPHITPDKLLRSLGTLMDVIDDKIYLMHQSVNDFFKEKEPLQGIFGNIKTSLMPAYVTMTYLQFKDILDPALLEECSFFRYCAQYWFAHIDSTADIYKEDRLRRMIVRIINPKIHQTKVWIEHASKHASAYIDYPSDIALELDIGWLAELLLDLKFQDLECHFREDCLSKAASKQGSVLKVLLGHKASQDIVLTQHVASSIIENFGAEVTDILFRMRGAKLLMTSNLARAAAANWIRGSDILEELLNRWGGKTQITTDVLEAAAANAFEGMKMMKILLEKYGHEIDITPRVLMAAAGNWREGEAIIRLLLEKKGQPQITSGVLHAAATNPFEGLKIMKLLFEEYKAEMHVTPSVVTAAVGNWRTGDDLARLLLDNQAELQFTQDALVSAARNEAIRPETLEMLIAKTGNINDVGKDGWTPIAAAASRGRLPTVNYLIQKTADIMIPNKDGSTPILLAAQNGCLDIVKFLAEKEADISLANKDGQTPAYGATLHGHLDVVKFLFDREAGIDTVDKAGVTAMTAAAGNGHLEVVKFLVEHEADILTASKAGLTPVHAAARNGHLEIIKFLIEHGADIAAASKDGHTPIYAAAENGHLDVFKFLIEHEASITTASKDGRTLVYAAAENGHLDIVKILFKRGADITVATKAGMTPLSAAASNGHFGVIKFFIDNKADITMSDKYGTTALHMATLGGYLDVTKLLVHRKTSVITANKGGWTPVHAAACNGDPELSRVVRGIKGDSHVETVRWQTPDNAIEKSDLDIVKSLFDNDADAVNRREQRGFPGTELKRSEHEHTNESWIGTTPNITSFDRSRSTLMPSQTATEVVHFLLPDEDSASRQSTYRPDLLRVKKVHGTLMRFLHRNNRDLPREGKGERDSDAAGKRDRYFHIIKLLMFNRADIKAMSKDRVTAVLLAAESGHLDVVKFLFENQADITIATKDGVTPVSRAAQNGHLDIVKFLFESQADITIASKDGVTPVSRAAHNGHLDVVEFLFENQADITVASNDGWTPVSLAAQNGHLDVVKFLLDNTDTR